MRHVLIYSRVTSSESVEDAKIRAKELRQWYESQIHSGIDSVIQVIIEVSYNQHKLNEWMASDPASSKTLVVDSYQQLSSGGLKQFGEWLKRIKDYNIRLVFKSDPELSDDISKFIVEYQHRQKRFSRRGRPALKINKRRVVAAFVATRTAQRPRGNVHEAAKVLGMAYTTVYRVLESSGVLVGGSRVSDSTQLGDNTHPEG